MTIKRVERESVFKGVYVTSDIMVVQVDYPFTILSSFWGRSMLTVAMGLYVLWAWGSEEHPSSFTAPRVPARTLLRLPREKRGIKANVRRSWSEDIYRPVTDSRSKTRHDKQQQTLSFTHDKKGQSRAYMLRGTPPGFLLYGSDPTLSELQVVALNVHWRIQGD